MSKKSMIDFLTQETGVSRKDVTALLAALPNAIETAVKADKNKRFVLNNVAAFKLVHKAERMGRNPQTNQPLKIAARDVLKITAVGLLKKAIA